MALPFKRRFWNLRNWHWVSSAICLIGMLLFSLTGITLNHAASIESSPSIEEMDAQVPDEILPDLNRQRLTTEFSHWYADTTGDTLPNGVTPQWSDMELYVAMPRPGGDRWFSVDLETGEFYQESTHRGVIAYMNDLHKGRNTGPAWSLFLDLFAVASLIFSITGLLLLKRYSKSRGITWPLILAGFLIPVFFIMLPAHAHADENAASLDITIPRLNVAEYHAPYVAVWLADEKGKALANIAVWYAEKLEDDEGKKWLKDMRLWWRRAGRSQELSIDGVSGATRRPGQHTVSLASFLEPLAPGNYQINVEAARELGGREVVTLPITLPLEKETNLRQAGEHELGEITLTMESR